MAELTFKSPGVSTREIDLSGPTQTGPSGIPAGVIGTAKQGRAFVPITVATFADFVAEFGEVGTTDFGPMALRQWLTYANAGTYVRTLGVGDAKKRNASGTVTNAGFVVGGQLVNQNTGQLANNPYAGQNAAAVAASLDLTSTVAAFGHSESFTINVPAAVGGEGGNITIIFGNGAGGGAANQIRIRRDANGEATTATDLAQLLVFAINGTTPAGAQAGGSGTYAAADVGFADAATRGENGVAGVTASRIGDVVTITADQPGVEANAVVLTDLASTPIADSTGASPANLAGGTGPHGVLGRTHILACMMSQSLHSGEGVFTEAGLDNVMPIIRGILLAPSGVNLTLSSSIGNATKVQNNLPFGAPSAADRAATGIVGNANGDAGSTIGDVNIAAGRQEFVMLQNGHKHTDANPTILTASFDPEAANYFANVFNTDPNKLQEAGHLLYAHYDVHPSFAILSGSSEKANLDGGIDFLKCDVVKEGTAIKTEPLAFLLTSSDGRNEGHATRPNFENFRDRFRTAKFPSVVSQEFGGENKSLFQIHCLDDGAIGNNRVKVSIENIIKSNNVNNKYGTFDLLVRDYYDEDTNPRVLERFNKLSLNPNDERYITRVIGDYHIFYDFDKRVGSQKLVVEGSYTNRSNYIRIEPSTALETGEIPATALPVGFRGPSHLVTSGSSIFTGVENGGERVYKDEVASQLVEPPIPMRRSISQGQSPKKRVNSALYWGIQTTKMKSFSEPNASTSFNTSIDSYGKYFPNHLVLTQSLSVGENPGVADVDGTVFDCDRFNNNLFSLEKIQVITKDDKADSEQWAAAIYRRSGVVTASLPNIDGTHGSPTRLLSVEKDFGLLSARKYLRFTMLPQGGFDGMNPFDLEKSKMSDEAIRREMTYENQGLKNGPTVSAFVKALDVLGERSDVDIQLLAIPGIRQPVVTDHAIDVVEQRFDAMYIMDIPVIDTLGTPVSGSEQDVSVIQSATTFGARNLDSSFAAAYFPDVIIQDPTTGAASQAPPSVAVLGAFGLNDSVAFPWYAPAGFTRGALKDVLETQVKLNRDNLDTLYEVDINPITSFPQTSDVVVFGQKTLLAAQSALDRVNVRRLLIDIRRQVRKIGDTFLFEPNRESTLQKFSAAVTPVLTRIQAQQGLERFKVQIDTTTTTQADIENNTVRGKIFLQPVRSVEFISLDFVVTNAGLDI